MARRRGRRRPRRFDGIKEKETKLYLDGTIDKALPNTQFLVEMDNGMKVLATIAGKMRRHRIRVYLGDRVSVEVSGYDPTRGRITFRHREQSARTVAA